MQLSLLSPLAQAPRAAMHVPLSGCLQDPALPVFRGMSKETTFPSGGPQLCHSSPHAVAQSLSAQISLDESAQAFSMHLSLFLSTLLASFRMLGRVHLFRLALAHRCVAGYGNRGLGAWQRV